MLAVPSENSQTMSAIVCVQIEGSDAMSSRKHSQQELCMIYHM